ncbi:hypothetical protein HK102_009336, partial [Quaeritorhiza haematococci]
MFAKILSIAALAALAISGANAQLETISDCATACIATSFPGGIQTITADACANQALRTTLSTCIGACPDGAALAPLIEAVCADPNAIA